MKSLSVQARAFLLAFSLLSITYGICWVWRDIETYLSSNQKNLLWLIYHCLRYDLVFFIMPLWIHLSTRKYWNSQIIHKTTLTCLATTTAISLLAYYYCGRRLLIGTVKWHWIALAEWSLLLLLTYTQLHKTTGSSLYSLLFGFNLTFICGILYELAPLMVDAYLNNSFARFWSMQNLVAYACFGLGLYRLEAILSWRSLLLVGMGLLSLWGCWLLWNVLPYGVHRLFAYPFALAVVFVLRKNE